MFVLRRALTLGRTTSTVLGKLMRTLGFIARFARHFRNKEFLRLPYVALVRPHVEYASAIWSPRHTKYSNSIERVQHKFLRFALRSLGNPLDRDDHEYYPVLTLFNIATLDDRRHIADMIFLFKVINGLIDCPDLFGVVAYNVPVRHMRTRPLFRSSFPKYHYYAVDPIDRAMSIANGYFSGVDPFRASLNSFRTSLYMYVNQQHRDTQGIH